MKKWIKQIRAKAILPAAALLAAAAIGTTFAWQTWDLSVTNKLKAHDTAVEVGENFMPWENKDVWFQNTGTSSVFLRVSYTEHWKTADGKILSNQVEQDGVMQEAAAKVWTSAFGSEWQQMNDGWYYYKKVLPAGQATAPILDNVEFHVSPSNPACAAYKAADYYLYFKAEVVQCSDGSNTLNSDEVNAAATKEVFGKTASVQKNPETGEITGVNWQ